MANRVNTKNMFSMELEGLDELLQELKDLPENVKANAVRNNVQRGAKKVEDIAKRLALQDSGKLASLIKAKRRRTRFPNFFKSTVGVPKGTAIKGVKHSGRKDPKGAFYAGFVEFGTVKQAPQPFLRPALEQKSPEIVSDFTGDLRKEINAAAKRHNNKVRKQGL
jgi:HK97 gp10 family phage protein